MYFNMKLFGQSEPRLQIFSPNMCEQNLEITVTIVTVIMGYDVDTRDSHHSHLGPGVGGAMPI